jgi:ribosomal protein L32
MTVTDVETRQCSMCDKVKPLATDFYKHPAGRDGYAAACVACVNTPRTPSVNRLVRSRARGRAYQLLAERHRAEFTALLEEQTVIAAAEHEQVAAKAREAGNPDADVARIKRGPKRQHEASKLDRVDVARCPSCRTHHDAAHECPSCGTETPEQPHNPTLAGRPVKPWQIREWAYIQGVDCPPRGPVPRRVVEAFARAHRMMPNRAASA